MRRQREKAEKFEKFFIRGSRFVVTVGRKRKRGRTAFRNRPNLALNVFKV